MNTRSLIRAVIVTVATMASTSGAWAQDRQPAQQAAPPPPEAASEPQGFIGEPGAITRVVLFADRHFGKVDVTNGFYVDFGQMIPGAGWISGGPGYRHWYARDQVFVDGSAAISWHGYKAARARFELPKLARSRLGAGTQFRWQDFPQVSYFGEGPASSEGNRSEYRLKSTHLAGYVTLRPLEWMEIGAQTGWLEPSILPRAGAFMRNLPNTFDVFPRDIVFALPDTTSFVPSEVSITVDTRDFPAHPTRGALVRAAAANYDDRETGVFSFKRYESEAAGFVPIAGGRVVLAAHGWLVSSETGAGQTVPFYLQPSLGGANSLRGYADYRFHDRNMVVVNAEARLVLMTHVDLAVFADAGNVAARVGDLNLDKRSFGAGLRLHTRRMTVARLDAARGDEGWRVVFRLTEPLELARLSRRAAVVPFVP